MVFDMWLEVCPFQVMASLSKCIWYLECRQVSKLGKSFPKPSQSPFQNRPKINPSGFLEPILDQWFYKNSILNTPKPAKRCQEHPRDVPDHPKPFPNGAQDPPKSTFWVSLWYFFPTRRLYWFFIDFWLISCCLSRGRLLQNTVKTQVFSMFLQNHNFW